jgi:uncharacterized protein (TIGR03435 family)
MKNRGLPGKLALVGIGGCLLLAITSPSFVRAQSSATEDWEKTAGGKMSFDVASLKPSAPGGIGISSNFLYGSDAEKIPNGLLTAKNIPLFMYIAFAYKLDRNQSTVPMPTLPDWARRASFDLEARPPGGNLSRDQVRLMMQSLLAGRFKLGVHFDSKPRPAYALILAKPGKLSPQVRTYPDGFPCFDVPWPVTGGPTVDNGRLPIDCGEMLPMKPSEPGLRRLAGRNVSMDAIAYSIGGALSLDRPLLDRTGLKGTFDVSMEYELAPPSGNRVGQADPSPNPAFLEAVINQLGLKLQSVTAPGRTLIIDHIEEPTPN